MLEPPMHTALIARGYRLVNRGWNGDVQASCSLALRKWPSPTGAAVASRGCSAPQRSVPSAPSTARGAEKFAPALSLNGAYARTGCRPGA
jgi:hypothetical protein